MSSHRRDFLRQAGLMLSSAAVLPSLARATEAPRPRTAPKALVHILLQGGMDAILTTDPKERRELNPDIDLPYAPEDIRTVGATRVGPLFKVLEPWVPRLAILNGVQCSTVSHLTGVQQAKEMRRTYPRARSLGLAGTLGTLRPLGAPLAQTVFEPLHGPFPLTPSAGRTLNLPWSEMPGRDRDVLFKLSRLARERPRRALVQEVLESQLGVAGGEPMQVARDLLARMPLEPLPELEKILPPGPDSYARDFVLDEWAHVFRDILFMVRHDLCNAFYVSGPFPRWDTHQWNLKVQGQNMGVFGPALAWFLKALETQTDVATGRPLSEQVGIVFSSELGRFPVKNEYEGKDHFPELPVVLLGPGLRPGVYGETDKRMQGQPISLRTGRPSSGAKDVVPTIDDVGATVLSWFGVEDLAAVGYLGERLDFLLA
ncbi:MAG: DUF1501 domain-containing protein [Myxococcaceae bacterium]|nr:DUF1501 domain-containing protein [Myxococcaceae bacterium]